MHRDRWLKKWWLWKMTNPAILVWTDAVHLRASLTSQSVMRALSGKAKKRKGKSHTLLLPLRSRRRVSQKHQTKMKLKGYTCLCLRRVFFYIHFPVSQSDTYVSSLRQAQDKLWGAAEEYGRRKIPIHRDSLCSEWQLCCHFRHFKL